MRRHRKLLVITTTFMLTIFWASVSPAGYPMELENRLAHCSQALRDMMEAPDGGIPSDLLGRSRAIVILPSVVKAGLGVGGHYGKGVVVRKHAKTGRWGPPAFVRLMGGSVGWQVGVESLELVLLVMNDVSLKSMFQDKFTLGADASVAVGPVGRDASAGTDMALSVGILSYSKAKGLFAGVSLKGSVLEVDWTSNEAYYGSDASVIDIFFGQRGNISPAGAKLIRLLAIYSQ